MRLSRSRRRRRWKPRERESVEKARNPGFQRRYGPAGRNSSSPNSRQACRALFLSQDDTPGCTDRGLWLSRRHARLQKLKALVIGVSKDSVARHDKFKAKYELPFHARPDEDRQRSARSNGTWIEKSLYGRSTWASTRDFPDRQRGVVRKIWHKVKVAGHVDE